MSYLIPILFQFYNNLDTTLRVLEEIRKIKPQYLYLVQDKFRPYLPEEEEGCLKVRTKVLDLIDWECDLKTLFREVNLGPGKGTADSIRWFFNQVDYGIILEHDCLPHPDFFDYCAILLEKYKFNTRIKIITGSNFKGNKRYGRSSYYFGTIGHFWGWAAWRRSFDNYIQDINKIDENEFLLWVSQNFKQTRIRNYWKQTYYWLKEGRVDTWDYQLFYSIWKQKGLIVIPNYNLVSNIGFGDKALHCTGIDSPFSNVPTVKIQPLRHPLIIKRFKNADIFYSDYLYSLNYKERFVKSTILRAKSFIRRVGLKIICLFIPEIRMIKKNIAWYQITSTEEDLLLSSKAILQIPYHVKSSSIGDYTYVSINSNISNTKIGKFCSIGPNFICGWGIHPINGISTAPMFYSTLKQNGITFCKNSKVEEYKQITIGNDVFIGANVIVLDGVSIGDGAVIGAGAVVSKDIPAYAIAVGCPIRILRYRFRQDQIDKLLKIKWWNFSANDLHDVEKLFFELDSFIKKYGES